MRKKSHISLSHFLIESMDKEELVKHKKAFYIGSILPDCVPSFLTRRHTLEDTFYIVRKEMNYLITEHKAEDGINCTFCRHLGVITHYMADYFTFPHNKIFTGSMKEHCRYEKLLKHKLKEYVQNQNTTCTREVTPKFKTVDELLDYILQIHQQYLAKLSEIKQDIFYIVSICFQVVDVIVRFIELQWEENLLPQTVLDA